jgi:hypothetical protein
VVGVGFDCYQDQTLLNSFYQSLVTGLSVLWLSLVVELVAGLLLMLTSLSVVVEVVLSMLHFLTVHDLFDVLGIFQFSKALPFLELYLKS